MNNKALLYIIGLIVLSQPAFAAVETVFDNWIYSGQSISAEGKTFIIYKGIYNREIIADYGEGSLFVKNNSCQQTSNVRICLDNIEYYHDARQDRMKVRAVSLAPDITLTRTASDNELETKDKIIMTVTINNAGGLAQNLTYTDVYPEGIDVERIDGISEPENGVALWTRRALKEESVTFSYNVIVKDVIDRSFVAKLTYFDGRQLKTLRSTSVSIKSTPRLLHKLILGTDESLLGQKNNVTLNFTNKELLDSTVEAEIIADPGIVFTKIPRGVEKISDNHYKISTELKKIPENRSLNRSKAYYFEFKGTIVGTYNIKANVKYSTEEVKDRVLPELKKNIKFTEKGVKVRSNLDDFELEANQARTLRLWVQNLNPGILIKNVVVKLDGGGLLQLEDIFVNELSTETHEKIIEKAFYAPNVTSSKGYTIKAAVSYDTEFETNFSKSFTFTETVNKIQDLIISRTVGKSTLESGEETTVKVKVNNPRETKIKNIAVEDIIPSNFTILGVTRTVLTLDSDDDQTAYTYVIKAPREKRETKYTLNTSISYSDENAAQKYNNPKDYVISSSSEITVKPQKFKLTATRTVTGDIYFGDSFYVKYTLKNPTTDTRAENIELSLPLQDEFDIIGDERKLTIGSLEPEEEIIITNTIKRRAKKTGTHSLGKTRVTYTNDFGEDFEINVSTTSVKVLDKSNTKATFIFVTKKAKKKANNTDFFDVVITATSNGSSITNVELEDGDVRKEFAMLNGSTYNFTYQKKIETPGKYLLNPATALYEVGGEKFLTASDSQEIEIVDNPVVSVKKTAPEKANSFENFDVEIKVGKLADGVTNITIKDESELHYDTLTKDIVYKYPKSFKKEGSQTLPAATITYNYKGILYEIKSNAPVIRVEEKALLSINKTVSVAEAEGDEKIELTIKVKSHANDEIELELTDEGETWKIILAPDEEKTVKHKISAKQLEAATATYTYNEEEKTITSNIPGFSVIGEEADEPENGKVIKEKNIVRKILDLLISIVTWKRG